MKAWYRIISLLSITLLLAGCATDPAKQARIERALERQNEPVEQYLIGPSDSLRIVVWRNEDLSVSVPVRPDGRISVPLVGDIEASGKAPEALAQDIEEGLQEYLRQPDVSIIVSSMGSHEFSHRVRVTGAVRQPASQPYRQGMTVMDVILGAGGATEFADLDSATLYRELDDEMVAIPVDLDAILNSGNIQTNYRLVPGDIITVPERSF